MPIFFLLAAASGAVAAGPLQVATVTTIERTVAARDGTMRVVTVAGARARPGDRLIVTLSYRNAGRAPIANLVLADPVPRELLYRGPAAGTPEPDVSTDGQRFDPIAALTVPANGVTRPAAPDDIIAVRWRLPGALAPGVAGRLSFRAVLK